MPIILGTQVPSYKKWVFHCRSSIRDLGLGIWDFGDLWSSGSRALGLLAFSVCWVHKVHMVRKNTLFVYVRYPKHTIVLNVSKLPIIASI